MSSDVQLDQNDSGCISKLQTSWSEFLSWMKIEYSVYPLNPIAPEHSEFVAINSKIRIRCIHINPESLRNSKFVEFQKERGKNIHNCSAEEYWFTKLSKSFKNGRCNCSFRRSLRLFSTVDQEKLQPSRKELSDSYFRNRVLDAASIKIRNVDSFIERLIQDTIFKGLQEFYTLECKKNTSLGVNNLAFTLNEDSKHNEKEKIHENSETSIAPVDLGQFNQNNNSNSKRCVHSEKKKKPLIILLHGIGSSSDIWWLVIKSLVSSGYEIVAPDMLGHGYSSAPHAKVYYSFHSLLVHALTVFDTYVSVDENRKCVLIGHSYGCSFATAVYHYRMGQISQLILISGGGPTPLAPPAKRDELIYNWCLQALIQPLIMCGVNRSSFYSSRGKFFDAWEESCAIPNHVLQYVRVGQNWPEGDAAFHRKICVPTLLVHGLQDKHVTLVQECEMERTIPRSFLEIIPQAGHMSMLETPDHLIHMILCFLNCSQ